MSVTEMDLKRLVEECGEVIQAASKIMRFGLRGSYDDGRLNWDVLVAECADVLKCIERLGIDPALLDRLMDSKGDKIDRIAKYELGFDSDLTREQREDLHKGAPK